VSWEANNYVNQLTECPDGAELTRGQKCLLLVLSNFHNPEVRAAWPSVETLARLSLASVDTTRRDLAYLSDHCVIAQRKPERQGRGKLCSYSFLMIDDPERLKAQLQEVAKGLQNASLFCPPERVAEGSQTAPERVAEGSHPAPRNKEETGTKTNTNRNITPDGALKLWLRVRAQLEKQLPPDEVKLWVKPSRLQRCMAGQHLLIALPPSNRIIQAAYARLQMLRELLAPHHYSASFVKYADEHDKAQGRERFGIEVQTYGESKACTTATAPNC
jgi:hypothetical protein